MKILLSVIILILFTVVIVCSNHITQASEKVSLSVTEKVWKYESQKNANKRKPKTQVIKNIKPDEIIYGKYGAKLTIKSVSDNEIILNSNGGLTTGNNLLDEAPDQFILKKGSELVLNTRTLDTGSTITIKYK